MLELTGEEAGYPAVDIASVETGVAELEPVG